ncbi:hypothetical protein G5V57_17915 [Nordella sp. HKS 07]|uniref:hypothetical protein n=1 Tax=Nordella sp. HKS 07 TaxID=2712222 RepID=UPI0013E1B9EA|nr:hypothetical protein [Nordella sp. HKS 07]QIG49428.1 hypothetical protein G5V57_17915 [Nordella sp. HKS 07]
MAQTPTSKSAPVNNAAKDDVVGLNGDYTFTLADLLANDPGGAAKVSTATQFFFGNTTDYVGIDFAHGGLPSIEQQKAYLLSHNIVSNAAFTEFTIGVGGTDFEYMVQIGNKGTWSQADVHVTAPVPPPVDTHHNGALVAEWNFESHTQANGDEVGIPTGFWDLSQYSASYEASHPGFSFGEDAGTGFAGYTQVHGVDGHRALDTAASPGNIFLQAIPEGRGGAAATMPDLVAGKQYHAEVMIARQDYSNDPAAVAAGHAGTDPNAWVEFRFNDKVLAVHASDIQPGNEFVKFDLVFDGVAGEDSFSIMSHGTNSNPQGLLIDSIQIHDWAV